MLALVCGERFPLSGDQHVSEMSDQPRQQRFFVVKVVVNQRLAHAGLASDVAQGDRGGPARGDLPRCGVENAFAGRRPRGLNTGTGHLHVSPL